MQVVATAALAAGTLLSHAITQTQEPQWTQAPKWVLGAGGGGGWVNIVLV